MEGRRVTGRNPRARVVPKRQLIVCESAPLPDDYDLTEFPVPSDWELDPERTASLRESSGQEGTRDLVGWDARLDDGDGGLIVVQAYFREWKGYDLVFEVFFDSVRDDEHYNSVVRRVHEWLEESSRTAALFLPLSSTPPQETVVDLEKVGLPTAWGDRIELPEGEVTQDEFIQLAEREWLSYVECKKCGQQEICRFPLEDPDRLRRDAPCDVAALALRTTVTNGWSRFVMEDDLQAMVDALFHATRFVEESRFAVGALVSDGHQRWLAESQPSVTMSSPLYVQDHLSDLRRSLAPLSFSQTVRTVLVEGRSELVFLRELKARGHLHGVEVHSYDGSANRRNLDLTVRQHLAAGYEVHIQIDVDGGDDEKKKNLLRDMKNKGARVFAFDNDFEHAWPEDYFIAAAANLMRTTPEAAHECYHASDSRAAFLTETGLKDKKDPLAKSLAGLWRRRVTLDARDSEIGRWLDVLRGVPEEE